MPFDAHPKPASEPYPPSQAGANPRKIAVVGSGVAGLSAAWLLSRHHQVTVFEKDARLGGHANTVDVPVDGPDRTVPVDAGFIVFNKPNYPNLTALFEHLDVALEDTCMSFAASMYDGKIEYAGRTLSSVFANRASLVSPSHWAMLRDITRFHKAARAALNGEISDSVSLGDFVRQEGYSQSFCDNFLEPMASAIWSTPSMRILDFPAGAFFRFFDNHGLLQVLNMPMWNTVTGGSREYVKRLAEPLLDRARAGTGIATVRRVEAGVEVVTQTGEAAIFDEVVLATHADQALSLLADPTLQEQSVLGAFSYQPNEAYVHFDADQMPKRRRAWSSWNYLGGDGEPAVTYWMNQLQNLTCKEDVFVTLNPVREIPAAKTVARFSYTHPVFDIAAGKAQRELWSLQGVGGVWYCGAHFGQGFHEDGIQAGLAVAEAIGGVRRPWSVENESGRIYLPAHGTSSRKKEAA
ncbi:MAG: FAD-dependent oxidoreductase [Pseudomonadota bacterium]